MNAPLKAPPVLSWNRRDRRVVLALALAGAALFGASYFFPWWDFELYAPQYPKGLELVVSLTGVTGDTSEINIINHYIGMGHLEDAAQIERAYGGWLVGALAMAVVVGLLAAGRKLGWLAGLAGLGFPIGFLADTQYWLYQFGHDLDAKAPVHIKPFTPTLFGEGKVGQFHTIATPDLGFWLAIAGVATVALSVYWRQRRVCAVCPAHDQCGAVCPNLLVRVPR
jgi:copper chaperone NosL